MRRRKGFRNLFPSEIGNFPFASIGVAQINLSLKPDVQKLINERVNSGQYSTPEDVAAAAILALDLQKQFGDFKAGELDNLLAEGEQSIVQEGTLDGDEAFRLRGQRRNRQRKW